MIFLKIKSKFFKNNFLIEIVKYNITLIHDVKIDEYDFYKYNNYTVSIYGDTYGNQTGV